MVNRESGSRRRVDNADQFWHTEKRSQSLRFYRTLNRREPVEARKAAAATMMTEEPNSDMSTRDITPLHPQNQQGRCALSGGSKKEGSRDNLACQAAGEGVSTEGKGCEKSKRNSQARCRWKRIGYTLLNQSRPVLAY